MRLPARLALLPACALLLSAGFAGAAASTQAAAPTWSLRDAWDSVTAFDADAVPPVTARATVAGVESIVVGGATHDAARLVMTQSAMESVGGLTLVTDTTLTRWVRLDDGALLKRAIATSTRLADAPAQHATSETTYDAPCVQYAWPLEVGKSWRSVCTGTTSTPTPAGAMLQTPIAEASEWTVTAQEQRTVIAGTFDTFVLEQRVDDGTLVRQWYAPAACHAIRSEIYGADGIAATELASYSCRAARAQPTAPPPVPTPEVAVPSSPSPQPATPSSTSTQPAPAEPAPASASPSAGASSAGTTANAPAAAPPAASHGAQTAADEGEPEKNGIPAPGLLGIVGMMAVVAFAVRVTRRGP